MNAEPEVVSQSKYEETDYSLAKIALLAVVSSAASVAAVYELNAFLATFRFAFLWLGVAALLVFLSLNILNAFLIKHASVAWGIAFVESFAPLALFTQHATSPAAVALLLACAFLWACVIVGTRRGAARLGNSITIRFFEVARVITPKLMTGIVAVACVIVYLTYGVWGGLTPAIAHRVVDSALDSLQPVMRVVYPAFVVDSTVDRALREVVITQVARTPSGMIPNMPVAVTAGLAQLSPADKEAVIAQLVGQLKRGVEARVGAFKPEETVRSAAFRLLDEYVRRMPVIALWWAAVASALLLFFVVRGASVLFFWLINGIAFLVFKFLVAANVILVSYEARSREFVIMP